MKIDVVSIDSLDLVRQSWCLSRHPDAAKHWSEVHTIDVPVNELAGATLHFSDFTILEREVFASLRNHVMWARTSHVDDPLAFQVPPELQVRLANDVSRQRMQDERAAGGPQDEWRRHLPVTSETAWTARHSFRDLLKLVRYFEYLGRRPKLNYFLKKRLDLVAEELFRVVKLFTEGDEVAAISAVDKTQFAKFLHEGDVPLTSSIHGLNFQVFRLEVPLWLRAQVVRHRPLAFVDTFFKDVLTDEAVLDKTIDAPVRMELSASREFWRSVLSKRTCWLAQDHLTKGRRDPWQEIIDANGFSEDMLPCAGGACPYHGDAAHRLDGSDPGVPCPIFCDIAKVDKAPYRAAMLDAAQSRHEFWKGRIGQ